MDLSVVTTLYKSEEFIDTFVEEIKKYVSELPIRNWEIVMVDDGSPDNSLNEAIKQISKHPDVNFTIISLSRNFGHHNAILAGLEHTKGDLIFLIDSDMEVDPSIIIPMYKTLKEENADVVYGYLPKRNREFLSDLLGNLFWRVFTFMTQLKIPPNPTNERLMTRKYLKALLQLGDFNIFLAGMWAWTGFKQIPIPTTRIRTRKKTTYNFARKTYLAINAITSFSGYPLELLAKTGFAITFIALIYGVYLIIKKLLYPDIVISGFTSLMVSIAFSTGLVMFSLGVIGIYLKKIYEQVQNRPRYIIKEVYKTPNKS